MRPCARVGQYHVKAMDRHFSQQAFETVFLANQTHGLGLLQHRRKQTMSDELRDDVGDADAEGDEAFFAALSQDFFQFRPGLENLLCVSYNFV